MSSRQYLPRRTGMIMGIALLAMAATACFPSGPVEAWVPDLDGDGRIAQWEVDAEKQRIIDAVVAGVEHQRRERQLHPFLVCVRRHESDRGPFPHTNGYTAQNPRSTASGAYQFLDSTWRNVSARAGHPGYAKASHAPWWVQDEVALHLLASGGRSAWAGTGC